MPANPIPLTAPTAEDFRAWHRVQSAALAHDRPDEPVPVEDAVRARLTTPGADSTVVLWLVRGTAGEPVATAALRLFSRPGHVHLAEVDMTVHPAHRRLGAGSRLLSTVTDAARGADCRGIVTEVTAGTPGEGFLAARDFTPVLRLTRLRLALAEAPEQIGRLPDVPHAGYRLTAWDGVVPDELAAAFTRARAGTAGAAAGGPDLGDGGWDEARVRAAAEAVAARGERLLTVAAVSEADGEVAGYTELVLPAGLSGRAQQYDTAVLPEHRGHGLGLWLKAAMLRRVRSGHPGITEIQADNADENRHMLAVNTALGFRPRHRTVKYRLDLRKR
ncbi:Ribosomal protein S18 acetylase RimI [Actinacidiphila rubida]|uniref:Ribosomal protein S18 acetylase RimI n=1 Tax=Actinacidiphila rubida TaxID=310780 RepID=A0A1H8NBP6_9ACTN|nr:GNAT family N-acetyltransferase [Actinacidiphila rubida]SEO26938.1 Ribosomal protein S18 acetylase RimI [Actinacidiphila rubida]